MLPKSDTRYPDNKYLDKNNKKGVMTLPVVQFLATGCGTTVHPATWSQSRADGPKSKMELAHHLVLVAVHRTHFDPIILHLVLVIAPHARHSLVNLLLLL